MPYRVKFGHINMRVNGQEKGNSFFVVVIIDKAA